MFTLPSLWNLVVSTIVFFIVAWYIHRYLDRAGINRGKARGILVFTLASVVSWGSGEVVDWTQQNGPQPATQEYLSQLLRAAGTPQP